MGSDLVYTVLWALVVLGHRPRLTVANYRAVRRFPSSRQDAAAFALRYAANGWSVGQALGRIFADGMARVYGDDEGELVLAK